MSPEQFASLLAPVIRHIDGKPLDAMLDNDLNRTFPADQETFLNIAAACREAVAAGWMCNREGGGIKYGRVIKPGGATGAFSVDVVDMKDLAGPHHRHPQGEIDMIMPLEGDARFDGRGAGWLVYPPNSAHAPTVTDGRAYILYLLPGGEIDFGKT